MSLNTVYAVRWSRTELIPDEGDEGNGLRRTRIAHDGYKLFTHLNQCIEATWQDYENGKDEDGYYNGPSDIRTFQIVPAESLNSYDLERLENSPSVPVMTNHQWHPPLGGHTPLPPRRKTT